MDLRYPVGPFEFEGTLSNERRRTLIDQIAATPERMRAAVEGLDNEQLNTPYRPEGILSLADTSTGNAGALARNKSET